MGVDAETESFPAQLMLPSWSAIKHKYQEHFAESSRVVGDFIANALIFVLSKLWADAIAIYAFGLNPPWYCGKGYGDISCTPPASSTMLFMYLLGLVPVAGLLKHLAEWTLESAPAGSPPRGLHLIPKMVNFIVGWAAGAAMYQLMHEYEISTACADNGGCAWLSIGFSSLCTVVAVLFIVLLKPYVEQIEFGNTPEGGANVAGCGLDCLIDWTEDLLEDVLAMVSRGLAVTVMTLWDKTASELLYVGVEPTAKFRVAFLWAAFTIFAGGHLSLQLARVELSIPRDSKQPPSTAGLALLEFSSLMQSVFSYVVACAANDVITLAFPSLDSPPYPSVIISNIVVTLALIALCILWLLYADKASKGSNRTTAEAADRDEIEKFFLTSAMAFFVAWNIFDVGRCVITPLAVMADAALSRSGLSEQNTAICHRIMVLVCVALFSAAAFATAFGFVDKYAAQADEVADQLQREAEEHPKEEGSHHTAPLRSAALAARTSLMFKPSRREVLAGDAGNTARKQEKRASISAAQGLLGAGQRTTDNANQEEWTTDYTLHVPVPAAAA